jgi:hypothetical protein
MNVSLATIPPRVRDGSLFKCISALLNQTADVQKIFINLPNKFQRFDNLTEREEEEIKAISPKVQITKTDYDSPALKYLGCLPYLEDDDIVFVGDDDQEYHSELLEKMHWAMYDDNAVFQNRFHIVKHGTAGVIHGFVGLMFKKKVFKNIHKFDLPSKCWIDDQLMTIYFFINRIKILPSPVNDFDEIFQRTSNYGTEQIGDGALCMMDTPRQKQIKELERFYGVFFLRKNHHLSKGALKYVDYSALKLPNIHFVILDKPTKENKAIMSNIMKRYDTNYNLWNYEQFKKDHPLVQLKTTTQLNYWTNKYALEKIKQDPDDAIYINRNYLPEDLIEIILNEERIINSENEIHILKKTYTYNI